MAIHLMEKTEISSTDLLSFKENVESVAVFSWGKSKDWKALQLKWK